MTCLNRTSEFFALCQSLVTPSSSTHAHTELSSASGRYGCTVSELSNPKSELRTFHTVASHISHEVYSTSTLLSELTLLIQSRSRSLLCDESDRINLLIVKIKENIEYLNIQLDKAQTTNAHSKRKLGRNSQVRQEGTNVVCQLQDDFTNTTNTFKSILKVRSELMKERRDKRGDAFGRSGYVEDGVFAVLGNKPRVYEYNSVNNHVVSTSEASMRREANNEGRKGDIGIQEGIMPLKTSSRLDIDLTNRLMIKDMKGVGNKPNIPGVEGKWQLPRPCESLS